MNVAELPMILFTVIAQMCVGAFLVLGVVQTLGSLRFSAKAIDQVADPALLAIGPAMVFGLAVSMFHMHDVTNTFNVIRHAGSSWLSREILFGTGFAALGFLFAVVQLLKWGRPRLRQALAVLTALVGVGLVYSMSMIYYSL
ncbi:MAG: dimethyl sulfoxide reductase anchor subunit family protein, partial [Brooklawnia sp.]